MTDLSAKCDSSRGFKELEAQIDGSGSVRPEPDRMAEWVSTEVTKCMLQIVIDAEDLANVALDESSLATCEQGPGLSVHWTGKREISQY